MATQETAVFRGEFFKSEFAPTRRARAYATVAPGSVGTYAQVGAYRSFKKLPSDAVNGC
jgi:hypothetical protein